MRESLEVFETIRNAAKVGPGVALLRPFDGTLFMNYAPEGTQLVVVMNGEEVTLMKGDWSAFDAATVAAYERAWCDCGRSILTQTFFDSIQKYDFTERHTILAIVHRYVMQKYRDAADNDPTAH
jgi:hypothetical protein